MEKLKAIIIDDETGSRNTLRQKLILNCPQIAIIAECENAEQGIAAIEENNPDVVFLDVEMPRMNGFAMLQNLNKKDFELIFTTAYDHYAVKAIRFSALDYLVKPIEVNDLKAAVERAEQKRIQKTPDTRIENLLYNIAEEKDLHARIAIPSMAGLLFINISEIIYLEAESNYTLIFLQSNKKITVSKTLKEFEDLLPVSLFVRIHHSYMINKNFIQRFLKTEGGQVMMCNGVTLDVSRRKRKDFMKAIGH